jgi:integrase
MVTTIPVIQAVNDVWDTSWKFHKNGKGSMQNANVFVKWYGFNSLVNDISTDTIRRFKAYCRLERKYTKATINRKLASISKMVSHCRGITGFKFVWDTPLIEYEKENNQRKFTFSQELFDRMVDTAVRENYHYITDLWVVLKETGCRIQEVLDLAWNDVDEKFISLKNTKNGDDRLVPIFDNVWNILKRAKERGLPRPFPYSQSHCQWVFRTVKKKMGMSKEKEMVMHSLRHTSITTMLRNGVQIDVVQRIHGHSDIRMTQRYNHPTSDDLRNAVSVMFNKQKVNSQ